MSSIANKPFSPSDFATTPSAARPLPPNKPLPAIPGQPKVSPTGHIYSQKNSLESIPLGKTLSQSTEATPSELKAHRIIPFTLDKASSLVQTANIKISSIAKKTFEESKRLTNKEQRQEAFFNAREGIQKAKEKARDYKDRSAEKLGEIKSLLNHKVTTFKETSVRSIKTTALKVKQSTVSSFREVTSSERREEFSKNFKVASERLKDKNVQYFKKAQSKASEVKSSLQAKIDNSATLKNIRHTISAPFKSTEANRMMVEERAAQTKELFADIFKNITKEELLKNESAREKSEYAEICPHINQWVKLSNMISNSTTSKIVNTDNLGERVKAVDLYVRIADQAFKNGDFATAQAIFLGLNQGSVQRLHKTFAALPRQTKNIYANLEKSFSNPNYFSLNKTMEFAEENPSLSIVPMIHTVLSRIVLDGEKYMKSKADLNETRQIDKYISSFKEAPEGLTAEINNLNKQIESISKEINEAKLNNVSSLKLSYKKSDASLELSYALKVEKFGDYIQLQKAGISYETHKAYLNQQLQDINERIQQAEKSGQAIASEEQFSKENLEKEIEIAEWLYHVAKEIYSKNSSLDLEGMLEKFKLKNDRNSKVAEENVKTDEKKLDSLINDLTKLQTSHPSSKDKSAGVKESDWYFQPPTDKNQFEKDIYAQSLRIEPRASSRA